MDPLKNSYEQILLKGYVKEGKVVEFPIQKEEPLRLYASDFDANNQIDAIMSYYNNGEEYPLATRDMIVKQLPGLKKKYVRNRNYSSAPMAEVFDKRQLRDATVLEAYEFSNVWYENDNGSFRRRQLNIEAQIAPCFAILVDDLNADGITDLILAGNDYGSDVESGRYDAGNGTVLLGTGNGTFEVAHNRFIDFWATGQVREIVSISMTGGNTIVVLNNNAAAQTYTVVK